MRLFWWKGSEADFGKYLKIISGRISVQVVATLLGLSIIAIIDAFLIIPPKYW